MARIPVLVFGLLLLSSTAFADQCGEPWVFNAGPLTFSCFTITTGADNSSPTAAPSLSSFYGVWDVSDRYGSHYGPMPISALIGSLNLSAGPIDCPPPPSYLCTQTDQWVDIQYNVQAQPGQEIIGAFVQANAGSFVGQDASGYIGSASVCQPGVDGPAISSGEMDACFFGPVSGGRWDISTFVGSGGWDGGRITGFTAGFIVATPEPSVLWLLGTGLLSIAWLTRRRNRRRVLKFAYPRSLGLQGRGFQPRRNGGR